MNLTTAHRLLVSALLPLLLFSGCAEIRNALSDDSTRSEAPQISAPTQNLLNYGASLRNRSTAELNAELELLNRAYSQHRNEDNRLRLAIFHALAPIGDRARALTLLDMQPGENVGRGRNHPIAALLIPLLQENRRNDENLNASQQRLRDEQKRSEALQQKLDAIREIEKKMIERTPAKAP
ncbi:MAG: hypothetical protein JWL63_1260 [Rhodocyclales bacterium]|nr:hypothetical protein [Rhodocyclales bacterium]